MKYYDLNEDEQEILDGVEDGEFKSSPDLQGRKKELRAYAKEMSTSSKPKPPKKACRTRL